MGEYSHDIIQTAGVPAVDLPAAGGWGEAEPGAEGGGGQLCAVPDQTHSGPG